MGSIAERQEFSVIGAKRPCRFRDRAWAPLMTEAGWNSIFFVTSAKAGA